MNTHAEAVIEDVNGKHYPVGEIYHARLVGRGETHDDVYRLHEELVKKVISMMKDDSLKAAIVTITFDFTKALETLEKRKE